MQKIFYEVVTVTEQYSHYKLVAAKKLITKTRFTYEVHLNNKFILLCNICCLNQSTQN